MYKAKAYSAASETAPMASDTIPRRENTDSDVQIEILFCGVCHSDLHYVRNDWKDAIPATYPAVPGHEIVGRVTSIGSAVSKHKVGDIVAVGCFVESDLSCPMCNAGRENFCPEATMTFGSLDKHGTAPSTFGGYSESIVVHENFVLRVPENLDLAGAAPLLCAGITTYSPLKRFNVGKGMKVGIVGLGGLGHMAVKLAHAFGAEVYVFSRSESKKDDAKKLGADGVIISTDPKQMKEHEASFDYILNTVAANHDINAYVAMLKLEGNMTLVGAPEKPHELSVWPLIFGNRSISGSNTGGIPQTQEMLDFCGKHNITAEVEVIPIQKINEAYERLEKSDVKYRFVIDMASLKEE